MGYDNSQTICIYSKRQNEMHFGVYYNYCNYIDDKLEIIESVFSDVIEDEAVWCHSKNTAYEEGAEVITEAEADNIRDGYKESMKLFL